MAVYRSAGLVLFILVIVKSVQGQTPPRPQPDESSTAQITQVYPDSPNTQLYPTTYFMEKTNPTTFSYCLYMDYGSGNTLYSYEMGTHRDYGRRNVLMIDELSATFQYYEPFDFCSQPIIPSVQKSLPEGLNEPLFPARWTWLKNVTYRGPERFHGKPIDLWTYLFNDTDGDTSTFHILGVSSHDTNILQFYFMYSLPGAGFRLKIYDSFKNGVPPETVFKIPSLCPTDETESPSQVNDSQTPLRPKLAESFSAEITYLARISFFIDEEPLKSAMLYRDYRNKKLLQVNPIGLSTDAGTYHRLLRLDENKQYNYFSPFGLCHAVNTSQGFSSLQVDLLSQPLFKWVKKAKFSGRGQFQRHKVNMWTYTDKEARTFYSLGMSRRNPHKPVFLYKMDTYYTYKRQVLVFEKYRPGPPGAHHLTVPQRCLQ